MASFRTCVLVFQRCWPFFKSLVDHDLGYFKLFYHLIYFWFWVNTYTYFPFAWNSLPAELQSQFNTENFKQQPETFYFCAVYVYCLQVMHHWPLGGAVEIRNCICVCTYLQLIIYLLIATWYFFLFQRLPDSRSVGLFQLAYFSWVGYPKMSFILHCSQHAIARLLVVRIYLWMFCIASIPCECDDNRCCSSTIQ